MTQNRAGGRSRLDRRPLAIFTTVVMGWRIRKADRAAKIRNKVALFQDFPAHKPMINGEIRNTHEPWSVGRAMCLRKIFFKELFRLYFLLKHVTEHEYPNPKNRLLPAKYLFDYTSLLVGVR